MALLVLLVGAGCGGSTSDTSTNNDPPPPPEDTAPAAPQGLAATAGDTTIELSWQPVTNATSYTLYWNSRGAVSTADAAIAEVTSPFVHAGLTNGVRYYYVVTASNAHGESRPSQQVAATPEAPVLDPPPAPIGVGAVGGITSVTVSWSASPTATSYDLLWSLDPTLGSSVTTIPLAHGPYVHTELTAGTRYYYCVMASNAAGTSSCSAVVSAVPDPPPALSHVSVATFNLEWFDVITDTLDPGYAANVTKLQGIADVVTASDFDVVAVEEVSSATDLATWITDYLDPALWDYRLGTTGGQQKVGFIYRKDLLSVGSSGELDYASSGGLIDDYSATWLGVRLPYRATLTVSGRGVTFDIVVLHLKAMSDDTSCDRRRAQVDDLEAWISAYGPQDLVLLGDFNDEIPGLGICSTVDTLAPFEADTTMTFATLTPTYMSALEYTNIPYQSTIDHIFVSDGLFPYLDDVDVDGHKAAVVMHDDLAISDHQPPFVWVGVP